MNLNNRNRAMLLGVAGAYVIYLAYSLLRDYLNGAKGMPGFVFILSIIVLGGGGLATLWYAWKVYRTRNDEEEEEKQKENDTGSGLK